MPQDPVPAADSSKYTREQTTPTALKVKRAEQELRVTWRDGHESVLPAVALRKSCPCATCRTEREKQTRELLPVLKQAPSGPIELSGARLVGTYAIQLIWSDGHDTGIYDYKYLRAMDARS